MSTYRKRDATVDAYRFMDDSIWDDENAEYPEWIQDAINDGVIYMDDNDRTRVCSDDGHVRVKFGDYIVRYHDGELFPAPAGVFERMYEEIKE